MCEERTYATIPLSSGKFALVDGEDHALLSTMKWSYQPQGQTAYAYRGYKNAAGKNTGMRMHRLIMQPPEGLQVDHINGNGLDNRRHNLRIATARQNVQHRTVQHQNKSGFRGVYPTRGGRFFARISSIHPRHLGTFTHAAEAARVYDVAALQAYGEFAVTNRMMGLLD